MSSSTMDMAFENVDRHAAPRSGRSAREIGGAVRQPSRRAFGSAAWALALALIVPITVFVFGAVRAREFNLRVDSRWANFAPFANLPAVSSLYGSPLQKTHETGRIAVKTASIRRDDFENHAPARRSMVETNMTGSVSGHRSLELSVGEGDFANSISDFHRESEQRERTGHSSRTTSVADEQAQLEFPRPNQNHESGNSGKSTERIELQIKQVRQKLDRLADQLAKHQEEQDTQGLLQHAQILEQQRRLIEHETKLSDALNEISQSVKADRANSLTGSTASDAPADLEDRQFAIAQGEQSTRNPLSDDSIRIRKETGRDMIDLFTMDVEDADIRQFLMRLSDVARVGILPSPAVHGSISLHLHGVRLESALKAIVRSRDYVFEREHGIIVIRTAEEAARMKSSSGKLALKTDGSK